MPGSGGGGQGWGSIFSGVVGKGKHFLKMMNADEGD